MSNPKEITTKPNLLLQEPDPNGEPIFAPGPPLRELLSGALVYTTSLGDPDPKNRLATVSIEFRGEGYMERSWALKDHLEALVPRAGDQS